MIPVCAVSSNLDDGSGRSTDRVWLVPRNFGHLVVSPSNSTTWSFSSSGSSLTLRTGACSVGITSGSVLVPVAVVEGVTVAVVDVVDMVAVLDRLVSALRAVLVLVRGVGDAGISTVALVPVPVVLAMEVAVVDVVDVVAVSGAGVAALRPVLMIVFGVDAVFGCCGHEVLLDVVVVFGLV